MLEVIKANLKPHQRIFIGCIDPNNARVETPDDVAHVLLDAAMYIPVEQLGGEATGPSANLFVHVCVCLPSRLTRPLFPPFVL